MASLNAVQALLQQCNKDIKSDLSKQLNQKVNILGSYLNSLQTAVSTITKSQRLINITEIKESCQSNHIGFERIKGEIKFKLDKNSKFDLIFNDLTVREDSGVIDQAICTIKNALGYCKIKNYNGISIKITQINAERLQSWLNPHIEIKEAVKKVAITQLKDNSSFFHRNLLP